MSLLDDLKQQAETLRHQQQTTEQLQNRNLVAAHARLQEALLYWVELFKSLNVIKPEVRRTYYLEAVPLPDLLQVDYNVNARRKTVEHADFVEAVILRFHCRSPARVTIEKQGDATVQRLRENLWSCSLKFEASEQRSERGYIERGTFTVACDVPVMITIAADLEQGNVKIATKNLERFGEAVYVFGFDEFTKDVNEELAKVVLAKPSNFRLMGSHQQALRPGAGARPAASAAPAASDAPAAAPAPQDEPEARSGLLGRISSLLKR